MYWISSLIEENASPQFCNQADKNPLILTSYGFINFLQIEI